MTGVVKMEDQEGEVGMQEQKEHESRVEYEDEAGVSMPKQQDTGVRCQKGKAGAED